MIWRGSSRRSMSRRFDPPADKSGLKRVSPPNWNASGPIPIVSVRPWATIPMGLFPSAPRPQSARRSKIREGKPMRDSPERRDPVEQLLATGLRNRWWCIGPSAMFQDKPVALTRLGEKLVGWRDANGKLNLVANQCPHRGTALSLGRVINGNIACRYHGVQ